MLSSYHRRAHPTSYEVQRFRHIRPSAVRYPRLRPLQRHTMMNRPGFYRPSLPAEKSGFFGGLLAMFSGFRGLNRSRGNRRTITSGGGGVTSGSSRGMTLGGLFTNGVGGGGGDIPSSSGGGGDVPSGSGGSGDIPLGSGSGGDIPSGSGGSGGGADTPASPGGGDSPSNSGGGDNN